MIRYALGCDDGHAFEAWFRDSASFDELAERGLLSCPQCGSAKVGKQIMAPSVARTNRDSSSPPPKEDEAHSQAPASSPVSVPATAETAGPVALLGDRERAFRELLKAVREHVISTAENVGPRFADEARRMHDGLSEFRSIYGEATPEEARALAEDGIEAVPLPLLPDERN